ncbi:macrophage-expressed gene 1 protein-like [Scleropages formosus]|uniref:macrophage-expressed gene 1 protein-like n=1 Tax=Scleropages formosus TaxID=113540 RepID=UPI000877EBD5|nr:macrophage-expressed gene 1 protein-like [Scleropages formosus]
MKKMAICAAILCALLPLLTSGLSINSSSLNECIKALNLPALEVLPGRGWDNLRNVDAGRVMKVDYTLCQTTEDGRYLLPDQVVTAPQKSNTIEINSEIVDSWLDYKSETAYSINQDSSWYFLLNGKFSLEIQKMKQHQTKENTVISRIEMRNNMYTVQSNPSFTLDPVFKSRVTEIATALQNNDTQMANFLSETLVLDYGTHVLTSVDAGAILAQEDYLRRSAMQDSSVTAHASILFYKKMGISLNYKLDNSNKTSPLDYYIGNITYSMMISYGGTPFYPDMTLKDWETSITDNLVAIDRFGVPLHLVLSQDTLPDLPEPIIFTLRDVVSQAIQLYYTVNTIPGCTDPGSQHFNYQANVDDHSCTDSTKNFSFGGVFQQCTPLTGDPRTVMWCKSLTQKNPITGNMSCGALYNQTLLRTEVKEQNSIQFDCQKSCYSCWLIFTCCEDLCSNTYAVESVRVETYWCSASNVSEAEPSGAIFGGLYGPTMVNPLTNTRSCLSGSLPATLLSDGLKICLAKTSTGALQHSVQFGGLFSCEAGNTMAGGIYHCPQGYIQESAGVSDGCEILYCLSGIETKDEVPIQLPPYTQKVVLQVITTSKSVWCRGSLRKVLGMALAITLSLLMKIS